MSEENAILPEYLSNVWTWRDLRCVFENLQMLLEPLIIPTREEADRHRDEERRSGSGPLDIRFEWDHTLYPRDNGNIELIENFNRALAAADTDFTIVKKAISTDEFTCDFIRAWGNLQCLSGRLYEIRHNQDRARIIFSRSINAGESSSTKMQHIWYARSLLRLCPNLSAWERKRAQDTISSLCREIFQGERPTPAGFDRTWFGALITRESEDYRGTRPPVSETPDGELVCIIVSLARMGTKKLKELAATEVPMGRLPPLLRQDRGKIFFDP